MYHIIDGIPSDHRDNLRNYDLRHLPIPPPESHRKAEDHHVDYHNFKEGRDVVIPPLQPMKPKLKNGRVSIICSVIVLLHTTFYDPESCR